MNTPILIASTTAGLAVITALSVLLIVSRRQLKGTRRELRRSREDNPRRRRRPGLAPFAIKKVWRTADSLMTKGVGATFRNSIEDLAGWARVERPDLARLTADGGVVIAFSDIEGSTELNEALGDKQWVKVLERHNRLICDLVDDHGGHVVKNQGDGFMLAFADPGQAVLCGIAVQRALGENADRFEAIRVRIGVHMGTSVRRGDDLFGRNVAMAARVAGQAGGGEVLVSAAVRDALQGRSDIEFGPPREVELKGLRDSHRLYPVEPPHPTSAGAETSAVPGDEVH